MKVDNMSIEKAIKRVMFEANTNAMQTSLKMNKSRAFVSNTIKNKGVTVNTLIDILNTCDYELCAIPKSNIPNDALIIDASED